MTDPTVGMTYTFEGSVQVAAKTGSLWDTSASGEEMAEILRSMRVIASVVPHDLSNMWSGHFLPMAEAEHEFEISVVLAQQGLYKQAMASLRSAVELGILSVYWNLNDDGQTAIRDWLNSQENTPWTREVVTRLREHANFSRLEEGFDFETEIKAVLSELHKYVHSRGARFSNAYATPGSTNSQSFELIRLQSYTQAARSAVRLVAILHLTKYPIASLVIDYDLKFGIDTPSFGGLQPAQIEWIEQLVGDETMARIRAIADEDEMCQGIVEWVDGLPDMTEDEIEEQVFRFECSLIELGGPDGYNHWVQQQDGLPEELRADPRHRARRARVEAWAQEQGFASAPLADG